MAKTMMPLLKGAGRCGNRGRKIGGSGSGGKTEKLSICAVAAPSAVDYADTGSGDVPSLKIKLLVSISPMHCAVFLLSRVLLPSSLVLVLMLRMVWLSASIVIFLRLPVL